MSVTMFVNIPSVCVLLIYGSICETTIDVDSCSLFKAHKISFKSMRQTFCLLLFGSTELGLVYQQLGTDYDRSGFYRSEFI